VTSERNMMCPCGSNKKVKKCCGNSKKAAEPPHKPKGVPQVAQAMLAAGIDKAVVYAYYNTGEFIVEESRHCQSVEGLQVWDAHLAAFAILDEETQSSVISQCVNGAFQ